MATEADVERLALALPGVVHEGSSYRVGGKLLAWPWLERVHPKRARLANPEVLVVRVASEARKFELVALQPEVFFTEPHYDGYAAVLVRFAGDLDRSPARGPGRGLASHGAQERAGPQARLNSHRQREPGVNAPSTDLAVRWRDIAALPSRSMVTRGTARRSPTPLRTHRRRLSCHDLPASSSSLSSSSAP